MRPAYGQSLSHNTIIRYFRQLYLVISRKFTKTVITLEGRYMSLYPVGLFLVSPGPTYEQNITQKLSAT
jgi:hypothetical protein